MPTQPLTPQSQFSEAIEKLLGNHYLRSPKLPDYEFGPGAAYVIELPSQALLYLSQKAESFLPSSFGELITPDNSYESLIHPQDLKQYHDTLEHAQEDEIEIILEYRIATSKQGDWLPIIDYRNVIRGSEKQKIGYAGKIIHDAEKTCETTSLIQQSNNSISLKATRRYLHDFNNTIAGIFSLSELYTMPGSKIESLTEAMGHICKNSLKAQGFTEKVRELLIAKQGEQVYSEVDELIQNEKDHFSTLLPNGVDFSIEGSGKSLPIYIDPHRFRQVLLHLASNAGAACTQNASVKIRCSASSLDGGSSPAARIEIIDNGCGIETRNLANVFEPSFTTKDTDQHKGMGLHIVKRFAESMGGKIEIESQEHTGTTVALSLPLANLSTTLETTPTEIESKGTSRNILIYTWEDIARHPLLQQLRDDSWKYRIHLDPFQLMLDIKELGAKLDGVVVFLSDLDEKALPLVKDLANLDTPPQIALISMGGNIEAWPESLRSSCGFEASANTRPSTLIKRLGKYFILK